MDVVTTHPANYPTNFPGPSLEEIQAKQVAQWNAKPLGPNSPTQGAHNFGIIGGGGIGGGQCNGPISEPALPLRKCAHELLVYLYDLRTEQEVLYGGAFAPVPKGQCGSEGLNEPDESLETTLRRACRLAASLVGEARTINAKLLG